MSKVDTAFQSSDGKMVERNGMYPILFSDSFSRTVVGWVKVKWCFSTGGTGLMLLLLLKVGVIWIRTFDWLSSLKFTDLVQLTSKKSAPSTCRSSSQVRHVLPLPVLLRQYVASCHWLCDDIQGAAKKKNGAKVFQTGIFFGFSAPENVLALPECKSWQKLWLRPR